jgi:hypothetical protein
MAKMADDDPLDLLAQRIATGLKNRGLNFVAIDFDLTLISVHTNSRWSGSAEELRPYARPFFTKLIPQLINNGL